MFHVVMDVKILIERYKDKGPLHPPNDIIFDHKEFAVFNNPKSGVYEQSKEERNVYYHGRGSCILPQL